MRRLVLRTRPFDMLRATEIALLKTFAVPSIARILVNAGEFQNRPQKRYDDTDLLLSTLVEEGYHSAIGRQAIVRINRMHARHPISNEQMLYVLGTFVVEPILWMRKFAVKDFSPEEEEALFTFWSEIGRLMLIRDLPKDLPAMLAYHNAYEEKEMLPSPDNRALFTAVLPTIAGMMPKGTAWILPLILPSLLEERLCLALGLRPAPRPLRSALAFALRLRSRLALLLPARDLYRTRIQRPTYPQGYRLKDLGT